MQALIIILVVLIPASGLFRIDPEAGAFVVLDRQVWFSDFFLMTGLWIFLASCLVMLYSVAGTVICGWACPQNTLAEWANNMTRKLLGKRAEVSLNGEAPRGVRHQEQDPELACWWWRCFGRRRCFLR